MTDKPLPEFDAPKGSSKDPRKNSYEIPRSKMILFAFIFSTFVVGMYASTWYRIRNDGYMGTGNDQLAHPPKTKAEIEATRAAPNK